TLYPSARRETPARRDPAVKSSSGGFWLSRRKKLDWPPRSRCTMTGEGFRGRGPANMAGASARTLTDHLPSLSGDGTCTGLSDGDRVERFLGCRAEGGERAFEALVKRHGPMVHRVCRNLLDDPNDVHDAVQAVFLVLARRAGSIRLRTSVGSW